MNKEEFIKKLKELNLTIKDFSQISNISYSTISNWGYSSNEKVIPVPNWVEPFLINYEKARKYDYLSKEIFDVMKDIEDK